MNLGETRMTSRDEAASNRRLAKNTIMLYMRSIFTLLIGLYTSRVVLSTLGVEDYGIYNIVGGFVILFSIVSSTMTATTQRYLTFELGKWNYENSREVFGTAMAIHIGLVVILLVLLETVGLWFLNYRMNIVPERIYAANWVFQFSILGFVFSILSSPYIAAIIAHEKMGLFAYISIFDASLKLLVIYLLPFSSVDKLIIYSMLLFVASLITQTIYVIYSRTNFDEVTFAFVREKAVYKNMAGFAGMNFLGSFSAILSDQGVNILLNLFFGVAVNASRGLAVQVQGAVMRFVNDFMTALNPQITKSFASSDVESMMELVYRGAKFSFYLLLFFSLPVLIQTPYVLSLWLNVVPAYTVVFVRLTLALAMVNVLSNPLITAILATGNIKSMCLWIGGVRLLVLPFCYFLLYLECQPYCVYYVLIGMDLVLLWVRLFVLRALIQNSIYAYIGNVLYRILPVSGVSLTLSYAISGFFSVGALGVMAFAITSLFMTASVIYLLGLKKKERDMITNVVVLKCKQLTHKI